MLHPLHILVTSRYLHCFYIDSELYIGNRDLYRVLVECNVSGQTKDKILSVLRSYTNPMDIRMLPHSFKTAVGKYPNFIIEDIDNTESFSHCSENSENEDSVNGEENEKKEEPANKRKRESAHFIYFGLKQSMENGVAKFIEISNETSNSDEFSLDLHINTDGIQLHKKSRRCFWPILGQFVGSDVVFTIALYCGVSKPKNNNAFLEKFVKEMEDIVVSGVTVNNRKYRVRISAGIFDNPARSFIFNLPYFNSREGCHQCTCKGEYMNHRMYFVDINAPKRTITRDSTKSLLFKIIDPDNIPVDVLHYVHEGVMKKLMTFWAGYKKSSRFSLTPSVKQKLCTKMENLESSFPREFNRPPRSLRDFANLTAKEFRAILLYSGPVIFKDILPPEQYFHFLSLHVAFRILEDEEAICNAELLDYSETLLRNFVTDFSNIYSPEYVSIVVHGLIHIVDDVRRHRKPVMKFSTYPFENYNAIFRRLVKSGKSPAVQVARRIYEWTLFQPSSMQTVLDNQNRTELQMKIPDHLDEYRVCKTPKYHFDNTHCNRFCEIDGRIFMIHHFKYCNGSQPYTCGVFVDSSNAQLEELYSIPCSSSHVGLITASIPNNLFSAPLVEHAVADITGKYVCLPMESNHVFIKLI